MFVELKVPTEFQGTVAGDINKWVHYSSLCSWMLLGLGVSLIFNLFHLNFCISIMCRRKGVIVGNDQDGDDSVITANVSETCFLLKGTA